jgi:muramoyltetrapeptide carboxypeptidase
VAAQTWLPLKEGDTVDLVAPGSACDPKVLENGMRVLASWGLEPRVPKKIFGRDVICAHDDATRFRYLKEALLATDSKAIWCVRGGYGSNRLIPALMKLKRPAGASKLFMGLSDISTLHMYLNQNWGWPTIHGPLLDRFAKGEVKPQYEREVKKLIFGEMDEIRFSGLKAMNEAARFKRSSVIRAPVTGGNLITLQSAIGTACEWQTKGKILFFEEIGERGYRVDRALEHFKQAGAFDRAKAIVFGDFTGGLEPGGGSTIPQVLKRFASEMKIPVFSGLKSGHDVVQRPLPFGTAAELHLGSKGELVCRTGVRAGLKA